MEETLNISSVAENSAVESEKTTENVADVKVNNSLKYDSLNEEIVLLKAELKSAKEELSSLKEISKEFNSLKEKFESRESSYEPISGSVSASNVEPQRFETIHDFYNYHFTK